MKLKWERGQLIWERAQMECRLAFHPKNFTPGRIAELLKQVDQTENYIFSVTIENTFTYIYDDFLIGYTTSFKEALEMAKGALSPNDEWMLSLTLIIFRDGVFDNLGDPGCDIVIELLKLGAGCENSFEFAIQNWEATTNFTNPITKKLYGRYDDDLECEILSFEDVDERNLLFDPKKKVDLEVQRYRVPEPKGSN